MDQLAKDRLATLLVFQLRPDFGEGLEARFARSTRPKMINLRHSLQRQRASQQEILISNGIPLQKLQTKPLIAVLGQLLYGQVSSGRSWLELFRSAWKHWTLKRRRFDRIFSIEDQFSALHIYETEF